MTGTKILRFTQDDTGGRSFAAMIRTRTAELQSQLSRTARDRLKMTPGERMTPGEGSIGFQANFLEDSMEEKRRNRTTLVAVISVILLVGILVGGMILLTGNAHKDASEAAKSVSLLYLDELAGRREQVVEDNLNNNINVIHVAIQMLTDEDLSDLDHMRSYQRKVKSFSISNVSPL